MPRSNMSAVYQVVISFILLVTVAAYTANLAAFLTVSAVPVESAKDVCTQRQNPQRHLTHLLTQRMEIHPSDR